jgi:hypothetical protein
MLSSLPQQYREDPWIVALCAAMSGVLDGQDARAESLVEQLSLDTVSWNLETEECIAGIVPPAGASEEDRRSALKAKWRSGGKVTIQQIQAVADAWRNGEVAVSFPGGRIHVQFVGSFGVPTNMDGLKRAIALVIPAHLPVDYVLKYLLIRDIHGVKTLSEMDALTLDKFAGGSE